MNPREDDSGESRDSLDTLLAAVIREHREKVVGWLKDEPGSWGFLAGHAVRACRQQKGAALTDLERRVVWHRLWQLLTRLKEEVSEQPS